MSASESVLVAVASGSEDLFETLVEKMREIRPELPLYLISEFKVEGARWIPYHPGRTFEQNLASCEAALAGKRIEFCGLILQPRMPYWRLRRLALHFGGFRTIFFNEQLDHFMLRPRSLPQIVRHVWWRFKNLLRWELRPGGATFTLLWRLLHPTAFERPILVAWARASGWFAARKKGATTPEPAPAPVVPRGISVVVPTRDGKDLLANLMPALMREMAGIEGEVLVVDNGSSDGTGDFLREFFPAATVIVSREPLSFAAAVNRGIARARFSHTMLLNNDMVLEPGFFPPLLRAFAEVPELFCATAQIFFPDGVRREETGKAVMPRARKRDEFPLSCEVPVEGEDLTYVLYGSGGCSLYDTARLRKLGGFLEIFQPAYVEDLDLGWRAWQRGWPTVFAAGARLEHRHRATTSRYYTGEQLAIVLERNYLRFLAHSVASREMFSKLWSRAIGRLNITAATLVPDPVAMAALREARTVSSWVARPQPLAFREDWIPEIGSGDVAVFPGSLRRGKPLVTVVSPYIPFPLSHGGAVRMFNLMREAAREFDQVLVCFVDELHCPPREILDLCAEVVEVRRKGSHVRPLTSRPDVVEEFDLAAFHAALQLTVRKWKPFAVQLEFTQMAQYAGDCAPARTILVEHDVTLDLYAQLLEKGEDWETRQQYERWVRFEKDAWRRVDSVVVMSEKDREGVGTPNATALPNGVDLSRFQPGANEPDAARLLFIGSFAHLPNVLAIDFFLREAWPRIIAARPDARLHIIAGRDPKFFLERYRDRVEPDFTAPGVELEGFVSDPRGAYHRATVVIAPLLASAGTNIKIMEAMAMGKAIVSTPGGINGLDDLRDGHELLVRDSGEAMAEAILDLFANPGRRRELERQGRVTVEARYGWEAIGKRQSELYRQLSKSAPCS